MITVCDAMMGSGKSTCAINFMNENPENKYIYITPYLTEVQRIRQACPKLRFKEPQSMYFTGTAPEEDEPVDMKKVARWGKTNHAAELVEQGANVVTTHQAFMLYTPEMLAAIREAGYTLIIDEDVQVIKLCEFHPYEIETAIRAGAIRKDGEALELVETRQNVGSYRPLYNLMRMRKMMEVSSGDGKVKTVFWELIPEFFQAFRNVIILTYLFEGTPLYNLFRLNGIEYQTTGIRRDENSYHFDEQGDYVPMTKEELAGKIHICESETLNDIGEARNALSHTWFRRHPEMAGRLKRNLYNYFTNIAKTDGRKRMWTTFRDQKGALKDKGYTKRFVELNRKATNELAGCNVLVYAANVFMNPMFKRYYIRNGLTVDEDQYALSMLVQWIFRSAIRNGEEIWVYIPSRRMRDLLRTWLGYPPRTREEELAELRRTMKRRVTAQTGKGEESGN